MEYRRLGNSGLKVSRFALGSWLTIGDSVDRREAKAIIDQAIASGINHFDCADGYADGEAERQLGEILSAYPRHEQVLTSKVFWPTSDDPNGRGLSRKHIMASIESSLRNLKTDHLDIYYCHREDPDTPLEETVYAMDDLVRQGRILYWGTSMWKPSSLKKAIGIARRRGLHRPVTEQLPYNLLERWVEKKLPLYRRLGVGINVWSPLAGGLLTGKYQHSRPAGSRGNGSKWLDNSINESNLAKIDRLIAIANDTGCTPAALSLAWLARRPGICSIILGASSSQQLSDNLTATTLSLSDDTQKLISHLFR